MPPLSLLPVIWGCVIVEAVKKQMNKLLLEMEAYRLKDVNGSVQLQELAATVDGIHESVKQVRSVVGLLGELPEASALGAQENAPLQSSSPCPNLSAALHEISARVDHVETAALARQDRLEQLTGVAVCRCGQRGGRRGNL